MKALIAMSGGVDSSVAALLTQQQGYTCIGCTMKLYDNADALVSKNRTCCSLDDVEDARAVAFRLGVPYYVFNFSVAFRCKVIDRFVKSYEEGITPNPCIDCNRYLKFEKLYERARTLGCERIVTGHYARIEQRNGKYLLKKAQDASKDQSYVLYSMTQEQLAHTLFPLGNLYKTQARQIASEQGLQTAEKPDSQDICFVPNGDYAAVICNQTGRTYPSGVFRSTDGRVLGQHRGIIHYTIGQRRGLGIPSEKPLYVCRICPEKNEVIVGSSEELLARTALVENFHWISGEVVTAPLRCCAKIRYRQQEQPATVYPEGEHGVRIVFDVPQRAITPGQAAVLYAGDTVLGGGEIRKADDFV